MKRYLSVIVLAACTFTCGGDTSQSPASPIASSAAIPHPVVGLTGHLAFGEVAVGMESTAAFIIENSGNATMTVIGIAAPSVYIPDWTSGPIRPGASRSIAVAFWPAAEKNYDGMLTVMSDQVGGTNTIALSGTGTPGTPPPTFPPPPPSTANPPSGGAPPPATGTPTCSIVPPPIDCLNGDGHKAPTAQCNDGAWTCSQNASGTCSGPHLGVACWVCPGPLCHQ